MKGHIRPHCPKYIKQVKLGEIEIPPKQRLGPRGPYAACPPGWPTAQHSYMKDPKAKAFFSAFQALFINGDDDEEEETEHNDDVNATTNNEDEEEVCGYFSMVGFLKE
jgi:hypothetical protein